MPQDATRKSAHTIDRLKDAVLVAVIRESSELRARIAAETLLDSGIRALEITLNTPGALAVLSAIGPAAQTAGVVLGAGTVRAVEQVQAARDAGATFLVSPHTDARLIEAARRDSLVSIPGALTPTEIATAHALGADFVKIFPVSSVGGAKYLRLLGGPFQGIPLWVSGTVAIDEIEELVEANVALIGLTSALFSELPDARAEVEKALRTRVKRALEALDRARVGRVLLAVGERRYRMSDFLALPSDERARLEDVIQDRRGQAVRIRRLLETAGVPEGASVEVRTQDGGFRRTVSAKSLYEGGWLHYATDGAPLLRAQGGPLRLYVVGGDKQCDNVKGVAEIAVVS